MNESYAEAGVKRKSSTKTVLIKILMILLIVVVIFFGGYLLGPYTLTLAIALGALCFFVFPKLNIEYEYVFCDGQLDMDRISGNSKRKTILRIDFEKVEMVAPVKSHSLDPFNKNPQLKIKDFTSLTQNANVYAIILREEGITKVLFEPNEKMVECMKQKAPRKVATY